MQHGSDIIMLAEIRGGYIYVSISVYGTARMHVRTVRGAWVIISFTVLGTRGRYIMAICYIEHTVIVAETF